MIHGDQTPSWQVATSLGTGSCPRCDKPASDVYRGTHRAGRNNDGSGDKNAGLKSEAAKYRASSDSLNARPDGRRLSNSSTLCDCPGRIKLEAISLKGCRRNRRSCALGCGKIRLSPSRVSSPNVIKSKSSKRGSFCTFFGCRPKSFSSRCSLFKSDSGVSPGCGD